MNCTYSSAFYTKNLCLKALAKSLLVVEVEFKLKSKYSTYAHVYTLLLLLLCAYKKRNKVRVYKHPFLLVY